MTVKDGEIFEKTILLYIGSLNKLVDDYFYSTEIWGEKCKKLKFDA